MIQDIAPHVYHNHYFPEKTPTDGSPVAFVKNRSLWCRTAMGSLRFPTYGELEDRSGCFRFLFSVDEKDYFLALEENGAPKEDKTSAAALWEKLDNMTLEEIKKELIDRKLKAGKTKTQIADELGISRRSLYRLPESYGIKKKKEEE